MTESPPLVPLIRQLATSAIASLIALTITVATMSALEWNSTLWVRHSRKVQLTAEHALTLATDRQTSIRSFLLTADALSLVREHRARPELALALDSLANLTADNPAQHARVQRIAAAIETWNRTYADPVLRARDHDELAQAVNAEYAGNAAFAAVHARFEELQDAEATLYEARVRRDMTWRWAQVGIVALEALAVVIILLRLRRELLVRAEMTFEQQQQLEEQAVELEAQAVEQEALTADLEVANQELTEANVEAEQARDDAVMHEQRYRLLFERNPVSMWVFDVETHRFLAVNTAAVEHYGYTHEEFLSMMLEDIRPAEEVIRLRSATSRSTDGLSRSPGWRHRRKDGSIIHVDIVTHGIEFDGRDARLVLAIDVTARSLAETALRERNDMLRAVVDDSPLAIVTSTPEMIISRWNDAAAELFGWSADEAIGQSLMAMIPEERQEEYVEIRRKLQAGQVVTNFETQRKRRDGGVLDVNVSLGTLRGADQEVTGFVSILSDVTERKRLETQFRQSQKMEAVGQLAGGVAHDFNNLLTVITSYSQMLLAEMAEDAPSRADVHEINRAAQRAALLTKQLLAFSRQQMLRPQVLDLNLVIGGLEQMLRRLLREDIDIAITLEPMLGSVEADPGQIEQILMNLVVNARDAMPHGGRLSIETTNVQFESAYQLRASDAALEAGRYVMISVSDNGIGMTPDVQARAFEPFFTTKRLHEGTGLGLSTVYGIVKQSGGQLAMYSEVGHGTIFKIYLPRLDAVPEVEGPDESEASPRSGGGETVLVVEDDEALRTVACRALKQCGYAVLEAPHGRAALLLCEQHEGAIHLVVTDVVMPEMSGAELAGRIASRHRGIKVLLMSGYTRDEAARQGIASERTAFLEKPFTPSRLAAKVREVLDGGRHRAPAEAITFEPS